MRHSATRAALVVALLAAVLVTSGCANYWRYRWEDFKEIGDIGVTYSPDWQWAFYHSFESIVTVGYANYEATFHGWGHGYVGKMPFYLKAWGAGVYGDEQFGWMNYNKNDRSTLYTQNSGIIGVPVGFITGNSNPHYVPT